MKTILNLLMKENDYTANEVGGKFIKCPKCGRVGMLKIYDFPEGMALIIHMEEDRLLVMEDGDTIDADIRRLIRDKCEFSKQETKEYGL